MMQSSRVLEIFSGRVVMELITTKQAAKRIGVSYSHLKYLLSKQEISCYRLFGRTVRFSEDDLDNWLKQHRVPETGSSFTANDKG